MEPCLRDSQETITDTLSLFSFFRRALHGLRSLDSEWQSKGRMHTDHVPKVNCCAEQNRFLVSLQSHLLGEIVYFILVKLEMSFISVLLHAPKDIRVHPLIEATQCNVKYKEKRFRATGWCSGL